MRFSSSLILEVSNYRITLFQPMIYKTEPGAILERLAERASRYSINLDGFISRSNVPWFRGGLSYVWLGTLQLHKAKAVVKALANKGFLGDGEMAKVNLLLSLSTLPYDEPRLL